MSQVMKSSPFVANVLLTCSGKVKTPNTSAIGASKLQVIKISKSLGNEVSIVKRKVLEIPPYFD